MAELTLKERCMRRLEGMKANRQPYEQEAKEIAAYCQPARSRWLASDTNKGRQPNRRLNSSHGIRASRTLQGGMTSGLSSRSRPWFTLKSYDENLDESPAVRAYFSEVEKRMYRFIASTNFYGAVKTGYLELGMFGTEACIALEHDVEGMVCHQLTFGEYWLGLGSSLQPEALYRECPISVKQAYESFPHEQLSDYIKQAYQQVKYDETLTFYQAIELNSDYEPGRAGPEGKPWRSVYWDPRDSSKDRIIERNGFNEQPFWAPRWDTTGGDVWGQGPGHDALPDLRELMLAAKRKAEATDFHIHPEMIASAKVKLKRMPRNVVSVAQQDMDVSKLVSIPYEVPYEAIGAIREDVEALKRSTEELFYADLFMAITNMQGIQPRNLEEIAARNEEKLTQLGPVIESVNNEKLEPAIDRIFSIMERKGLLPPAPEEMRDSPEIKVDFISILTQMQRMVGLGQIERGMGFIGNLMGGFPEVRHKIDVYEIVDEYWDRAGAPPKALRSTEDATADADAEAQNAQAAAAAEAAGKAAPAGNVAVDAAELLSKTPQAAPPAVSDLVPLIPR
jgi:hypothetical protein